MTTARNVLDKLVAGVSTRANLLSYFNSNLDIIDAALAKCNWAAATDPGVGDDSADGYVAGSWWWNTTGHKLWQCESNGAGAAVWRQAWPSLIADMDMQKVYAFYTTAAGQVIGKNWVTARVNFGTKVKDSHNAVTAGASWVFTAPYDGFYHLDAAVMVTTAPTATQTYIALCVVNGVPYETRRTESLANESMFVSISFWLTAGQTVYFTAGTGENADKYLITDASQNWISIFKQ